MYNDIHNALNGRKHAACLVDERKAKHKSNTAKQPCHNYWALYKARAVLPKEWLQEWRFQCWVSVEVDMQRGGDAVMKLRFTINKSVRFTSRVRATETNAQDVFAPNEAFQ